MDKTTWLMYACMAVWAGFGFYLFLLARRQKNLEQRALQLTLREDEE